MNSPDKLAGNALVKHRLDEMPVAELRDLAKRLQVTSPSKLKKLELIKAVRRKLKQGVGMTKGGPPQDALEIQQIAPFWFKANWTISATTMERAAGSLKGARHKARLAIRLHAIDFNDSGPHAREHVSDILLPEGVSTWFIEFDQRARAWQVELGYLAEREKFFSLLHSPDIEVKLTERFHQANESSMSEARFEESHVNENLVLRLDGNLSLSGATVPGCAVGVDGKSVQVDQSTGMFNWSQPLQSGRMLVPILIEKQGRRQRAVVTVDSSIQYLELEKSGSNS